MPTYVILTRFTRTGIENVAKSPERTEEAIDTIESLGGELREFFVVMGRYDGVLVADFPDDETAARAVLSLGQSGNVTTETLKAHDLDSFREIVDGFEEVH